MKLTDLITIKGGVASLGGIIVGDNPDYASILIEKLDMPITKGEGFMQAELSNVEDQSITFARLKCEVNEKLVKRILLEGRFSHFTKEIEEGLDIFIKEMSGNEEWHIEYDTGWIDADHGDYQYKGREYVEENELFSIAYRVEVGYDENTRVGIELNILGGLYYDCGECMEEKAYDFVQGLRNNKMCEKDKSDIGNTITIDKYIEVAKSFLITLEAIKEEKKQKDYSYLLDILNCIKLEYPNSRLEIRFAKHKDFGDISWFYSYDNNKDTSEYDYDKQCNDVHDVFNHLKIDLSEMGAWQAYLLCKGTHILPTWGHGGYTKRKFVLTRNDIDNLLTFDLKSKCPIIITTNQDILPSVKIEGNKATISCCYWNDWIGLARETITMYFFNDKVYFLESPSEEVLFEYDCGIKY